ncbi:hypothetical protein Y032_0375g225 [Ancylostoma ceylanicum]|uniref:Uncharacterized protein n=1 Tax=Ancylostoma ceylanicum TaxID=53326 RepID=A0A016RTQ2_9BILA|nr:hypothetical protein Y032_0375g225 [Ancylostoma ceylanicum]
MVEVREFPFDRYPPYVRRLKQYRWKPLLIAMALQEFGAVWYMDTSVRWKKDRREVVYNEITCRKIYGMRFLSPLSCCIRPLDIAYSQLLTQRRWRRSDGYNTRDATCSEAVALRGCAMPKFAKLRIRRITHLARFGVSVNVHAL